MPPCVHAVARYDEVRLMLLNWTNFSSARGAGCRASRKKSPGGCPSSCSKPIPFQDRTWRLTDKVLSPRRSARRRSRWAGGGRVGRRHAGRKHLQCGAGSGGGVPADSLFPDAVGMPRANRRFLLPYGNMVFNSFGRGTRSLWRQWRTWSSYRPGCRRSRSEMLWRRPVSAQ
jgi:hypothetical protein